MPPNLISADEVKLQTGFTPAVTQMSTARRRQVLHVEGGGSAGEARLFRGKTVANLTFQLT